MQNMIQSFCLFILFLKDIPPGALFYANLDRLPFTWHVGYPILESSVFLVEFISIFWWHTSSNSFLWKKAWTINCFDSLVWLSMAQFCPYSWWQHCNTMWVLLPRLEILVIASGLQLPLKPGRSPLSFWFFFTCVCLICFSLEVVRILSLFPVF